MADLHYSDEEQAERLKNWWKENGTSVIVGGVLGIGLIVGVNFWRDYQTTNSEEASELFEQLVAEGNGNHESPVGERLLEDYSGTPYSGKAALALAKFAYDEGDLAETERYLRWTIENATDHADRHAARIRLARLLISSGDLDAADQLLQLSEYGGFESLYRELQGDLAMERGDLDAARESYETALASLPRSSNYAELLQVKIDATAGGQQ